MRVNIKIAISSKRHGPMRRKRQIVSENLKTFLSEYEIPLEKLVLMNQVHGSDVEFVSQCKQHVSDTDGLVADKKKLYLGVVTADCVPLLLFDRNHHVVGVVHAGYKGIISGVVEQSIKVMKDHGAFPRVVHAILGPSIGVCCYNVDNSRARVFRERFGDTVVEMRNEKQYINLPLIVEKILDSAGIIKEYVYNSNTCTSCHADEYFSYRKESPETYGEFMSIIGME